MCNIWFDSQHFSLSSVRLFYEYICASVFFSLNPKLFGSLIISCIFDQSSINGCYNSFHSIPFHVSETELYIDKKTVNKRTTFTACKGKIHLFSFVSQVSRSWKSAELFSNLNRKPIVRKTFDAHKIIFKKRHPSSRKNNQRAEQFVVLDCCWLTTSGGQPQTPTLKGVPTTIEQQWERTSCPVHWIYFCGWNSASSMPDQKWKS